MALIFTTPPIGGKQRIEIFPSVNLPTLGGAGSGAAADLTRQVGNYVSDHLQSASDLARGDIARLQNKPTASPPQGIYGRQK